MAPVEEGVEMVEMASPYKVTCHKAKLEAYLDRERIFPACLELDLSTECNRHCPLCPSATAKHTSRLELGFIERLLGHLGGETRGLLLSGGEPTMAVTFPDTLRIAREHAFLEIAVVTNGDFLSEDVVAEALCTHATAVRVSLYDWSRTSEEDLRGTLHRIEHLRAQIEKTKSPLQIGVSALTTTENAPMIAAVSRAVASAGAHWIYFHPFCIHWAEGAPQRIDQHGVLQAIADSHNTSADGFGVFTSAERYVECDIRFDGYHAAHFLLVVGADGMNYLGAEVKYQRQHNLADMGQGWDANFLWHEERLARIDAARSDTYPALGSRHRGVLYNHVIQELINCETPSFDVEQTGETSYLYPHIL